MHGNHGTRTTPVRWCARRRWAPWWASRAEGMEGIRSLASTTFDKFKLTRAPCCRFNAFSGACGTAVVAVVSHYPWFLTNNYLERRWPPATRARQAVLRNAGIGFASGVATVRAVSPFPAHLVVPVQMQWRLPFLPLLPIDVPSECDDVIRRAAVSRKRSQPATGPERALMGCFVQELLRDEVTHQCPRADSR